MFAARPMDDASSSVNYRRRFSLLTGPWRTSSRVVALLVLLFLVFCNVPGQEVARLRFGGLPPLVADMDIEYTLEHGWPFSFATRTSVLRKSFGPGVTVGDCFRFWSEVDRFRPAALLTNVGIALLLAGAIGAAFEAWRRARKRRWQINLRDLCAMMLVLSAVGAWYLHERQEYADQQRVLHRTGKSDEPQPGLIANYQVGGVTWLRLGLGDVPFEFLDRPLYVIVADVEGWGQVAMLPELRRVDAIVHATTLDLRHLAELPRLEALTLNEFEVDGDAAELPSLPRLRGLHLSSIQDVCRGIDRAPLLEVVSISQSKVDERTFRELSRLRELRELALGEVKVTAGRLTMLSSLPKLQALALEDASLDASALRTLGRFQNLTYLELWGCTLAEGGLKEVAALEHLQTLRLRDSNVASQDVAALVGLRLEELYLGGTQVDSQAIPHLLKLSNLRELVLPRRGFSDAEEELLRERLPKCQIHFD